MSLVVKPCSEKNFKIGDNGCSYVECRKEIVMSLSNTHGAKFLNFVFKFFS